MIKLNTHRHYASHILLDIPYSMGARPQVGSVILSDASEQHHFHASNRAPFEKGTAAWTKAMSEGRLFDLAPIQPEQLYLGPAAQYLYCTGLRMEGSPFLDHCEAIAKCHKEPDNGGLLYVGVKPCVPHAERIYLFRDREACKTFLFEITQIAVKEADQFTRAIAEMYRYGTVNGA